MGKVIDKGFATQEDLDRWGGLERELGPALEKALVRNDRAALRERKDRLAGKAGRSAGLDLASDAGEVRRREPAYAVAPEEIDAPSYADRERDSAIWLA
jgi:hypothetical protein